MARNQMSASLLRLVIALLAVTGLLSLGACGGGSGAPNNPFAPGPVSPGPVSVLPPAVTVFAHTPTTLTISGGAPPYQAFSSNPAILPITQAVNGSTVVLLPNDVAANTVSIVTIQDNIGQTATSTVTVSPAPIFNTLTITPARTTCGTNTVCSGDTAIAQVQVLGLGGVGVANRQVKFDVISGAYGIQTTNPAAPLVSTLTVVSDNNGNAQVILQAAVNAPTQSAVLRATELTTGNSVTAVFTIVQSTNGSAILSVTPATATISGPDTLTCSAGFRVDYFIYGGTPPYRVSSTFPTAVTLINPIVNVSGGSFTAITNGACVDPLLFTIVDATGRQTTATLINKVGTIVPPTPPTPPVTITVTPGTFTLVPPCLGKSAPFVLSGGVAPYNVVSPGLTVTPNPVTTSPGAFTVSGFPNGLASYTVFIGDSTKPQVTTTATVNCPS
jgi:hypothetical protein